MNRNKEPMVFDWNKAAEIIRDRKPNWAEAGLEGDFEWTGGLIYDKGEAVTDSYTYLASTWATPILMLEGDESIPCYKMEHEVPDWHASTKWSKSALDILTKGKEANEAIH